MLTLRHQPTGARPGLSWRATTRPTKTLWETAMGTATPDRRADGFKERVDLTPFVESKVLVRFEYITDAAVYEDGLVVDDIAVPELDFLDDAGGDNGWNARGFERTDNVVPVDYVVLVMERHRDGADVVRRMEIDDDRSGVIAMRGLGDEVRNAVVVVSPLARNTHHLSQFTLTVREGS